MFNARPKLDKLFNLDFTDSDSEFYQCQKESLKKGILFSPLNGQQINYLKSNQLTSSEQKATNYLLLHAFYINEFPTLRNKLCKILVFPDEEVLISFFYKGIKIKEELKKITINPANTNSRSSSLKVSWHQLITVLDKEYQMKDLTIEVKLTKESLSRRSAEDSDLISDSFLAWNKYCQELQEKMEVLLILKKTDLLNERIKLWGFSRFHENLLPTLTNITLPHKNLFLLGALNYHFMNELSNEQILKLNSFEESYILKAQLLASQLKTKDLLWISS